MAWQSQQPVQGQNGQPGDGSNQSSQPQGTEYTLQGVMRFLQTEWHRHERERNAWEIERQEMRVRIASLEGSNRRNDHATLGLKKYIDMLERQLKKERAKGKMVNGGPSGGDSNADESAKSDRRPSPVPSKKPHNSFLDVQDPADDEKNKMDEAERTELTNYLTASANEVTYLMVAAPNPQPPREHIQHPSEFEQAGHGQPMTQQELEHAYSKPNTLDLAKLMQEIDEQDRQDPRRPKTAYEANQMMREFRETHERQFPTNELPRQQRLPVEMFQQGRENFNQQQEQQKQQQHPQTPVQEEEQVSEVNHTFDGYGRPVAAEERKEGVQVQDADAWDFDETSTSLLDEIKPMPIVPSRPDTDVFPTAQTEMPKSPNRNAHRRRSSASQRKSEEAAAALAVKKEEGSFKVRFGLRGHLDVVRSVIFTGGGSPGEPELCTAGDDGVIKRWIIPSRFENGVIKQNNGDDMDVQCNFTHRGHSGSVMCLTAWHPTANFASSGRAQGDGWVFSGGQDASVRVWERGRVDPKATIDGHTDAVWAICVLPTTCGAIFGQNQAYGPPDRILLVSGSADASVKVWAVSSPPTLQSPSGSAGRRGGRQRGNSMSSGSAFPSTPQPTIASNTPFTYTLVHSITREGSDASPTSIAPLGSTGESFVVSYNDASVLIFDTRTGEELASMESSETYDGSNRTGVNAIVATTSGIDSGLTFDAGRSLSEEGDSVVGATGSSKVEGTVITGHEDCFIRFFDANSGQCTYNMLAHPSSISSLSLSPTASELVSAGHDGGLRFWSLEKRSCSQEVMGHRVMRGEGVCSVVWSSDGRWVVSGGGDGVVKVFGR